MNFKELERKKKEADDLQKLISAWDKKLTKKGLSMKRGTSSKLSYVGGSGELVILEKLQTGLSKKS